MNAKKGIQQGCDWFCLVFFRGRTVFWNRVWRLFLPPWLGTGLAPYAVRIARKQADTCVSIILIASFPSFGTETMGGHSGPMWTLYAGCTHSAFGGSICDVDAHTLYTRFVFVNWFVRPFWDLVLGFSGGAVFTLQRRLVLLNGFVLLLA